jgi:hypothetical protein
MSQFDALSQQWRFDGHVAMVLACGGRNPGPISPRIKGSKQLSKTVFDLHAIPMAPYLALISAAFCLHSSRRAVYVGATLGGKS